MRIKDSEEIMYSFIKIKYWNNIKWRWAVSLLKLLNDPLQYLIVIFFLILLIIMLNEQSSDNKCYYLILKLNLNNEILKPSCTWLEIGFTSMAIPRSFTICMTCGCFVRAYPCPILLVLSNTASIRFRSVGVPCQSVSKIYILFTW